MQILCHFIEDLEHQKILVWGEVLEQIPCGYQETTICIISFHSYDILEQAKLFSGDKKQRLTGAGNGMQGWAWLGHGVQC